MTSLSTKTFRPLNEATGLNLVAVKAPNGIEAINAIVPVLEANGVDYCKKFLLEQMHKANAQDCGFYGDLVFGQDGWQTVNYIFCANSGRYLTVLSSEIIAEDNRAMTKPCEHNASYFIQCGATQN